MSCTTVTVPPRGSSGGGDTVITETTAVTTLSTTAVGASVFSVAFSGRFLYVGTDNGLKIYDISLPATPSLITTVAAGTSFGACDIAGKYLVIALTSTFTIYDISDVGAVVSVSSTSIANILSIKVVGSYAFIGTADNYMYIVDIANPALPVQLSLISAASNYGQITNAGKTLFLSLTNAVVAYDISNPFRPVQLSSYTTSLTGVFNIGLQGRYMYHSQFDGIATNNLAVIDVSNPSSMSATLTAYHNNFNYDSGLLPSGKYLYVGGFSDTNILIYNISSPAAPVYIESIVISSTCFFFTQFGKYLVSVNNDNNLQIFEIEGIEVQTAAIGSLEVGRISSRGDSSVAGALTVSKGIAVGGYAFFEDAVAFGSSVTTYGPTVKVPKTITASTYTGLWNDSQILYNNSAAALFTLAQAEDLFGIYKTGYIIEIIKNNANAFAIGFDPFSYAKTFVPGNVAISTERITITGHGLTAGQKIKFSTTTTLPNPLSAVTQYYAAVIDANTIRVGTTRNNALANSPVVNLTTTGSGTHTVSSNDTINGSNAGGVAGIGVVSITEPYGKIYIEKLSDSTWMAYS